MSAAALVKPPARSALLSIARRRAAAARPFASASGKDGSPPYVLEAAYTPHPDLDSFRPQQFPFDLQVSAVAPQESSRRDDAVARHAGFTAASHDVADGTRGAWLSRQCCDVTVRRHAAGRNPSYSRKYAATKFRHRPTMIRARSMKPPRLCSS